jgi:hypothetical protein
MTELWTSADLQGFCATCSAGFRLARQHWHVSVTAWQFRPAPTARWPSANVEAEIFLTRLPRPGTTVDA